MLQLIASAFILTIAVGLGGRFVSAMFIEESAARLVGLSVAIGFAIGKYSYAGPARIEPIVAAAGSVAGIAVLYWMMRRLSRKQIRRRGAPASDS